MAMSSPQGQSVSAELAVDEARFCDSTSAHFLPQRTPSSISTQARTLSTVGYKSDGERSTELLNYKKSRIHSVRHLKKHQAPLNTMQLVLDRWNARRSTAVPPALIGRIAPTRTEGLNLRGVFSFPIERYAEYLPRTVAATTGCRA
jgi:hypothetical protein